MATADDLGVTQGEYKEAMLLERLYALVKAGRCDRCGRKDVTHVDVVRVELLCGNCAGSVSNSKRIGDDSISETVVRKLERRKKSASVKGSTRDSRVRGRADVVRRRARSLTPSESSSESSDGRSPSPPPSRRRGTRSTHQNGASKKRDATNNFDDAFPPGNTIDSLGQADGGRQVGGMPGMAGIIAAQRNGGFGAFPPANMGGGVGGMSQSPYAGNPPMMMGSVQQFQQGNPISFNAQLGGMPTNMSPSGGGGYDNGFRQPNGGFMGGGMVQGGFQNGGNVIQFPNPTFKGGDDMYGANPMSNSRAGMSYSQPPSNSWGVGGGGPRSMAQHGGRGGMMGNVGVGGSGGLHGSNSMYHSVNPTLSFLEIGEGGAARGVMASRGPGGMYATVGGGGGGGLGMGYVKGGNMLSSMGPWGGAGLVSDSRMMMGSVGNASGTQQQHGKPVSFGFQTQGGGGGGNMFLGGREGYSDGIYGQNAYMKSVAGAPFQGGAFAGMGGGMNYPLEGGYGGRAAGGYNSKGAWGQGIDKGATLHGGNGNPFAGAGGGANSGFQQHPTAGNRSITNPFAV